MLLNARPVDGGAPRRERIAAARAALARGDWTAVARFAGAVLAERGEDAEALFLHGLTEAAAGRVATAIGLIERAVARCPAGEYRAQLARLYVGVRRDGDAAATLAAAETMLPDDALSRDTMGCVYARLGDHAASLPHFDAAVALAPDHIDFRYNQAATLGFLGRTDAAEAATEALLARAPDDARAHHLLAGLRRQTPERHHIARLTVVRERARDDRSRVLLGYALTKEMEDVGREAEALATLCATNAAHRATLGYSAADDAAIFDAIEAAWPTIAGSPVTAPPSDAPIFVIGMPRTGTTLVDRILSSHPDVESAGELQAMPLAVKAAAGTRTRQVLDVDTIRAVAGTDMSAIGADYLRRARHHRRDAARRFVDKFPGNFHYTGIIARALPAARIVCLRRHPMDTVLSNFRNLFAIGSRYYDYSYDLADIAHYYVRFDRLMTSWRAALPGRVLELHYEDLVADQEAQTRRLLDHAGLDWSDACLAFHDNTAPVSTPSAAQVRRPMYRDAVARWKRHAEILAPARRVFEEAGIAID
ncbi:tetratricopeptide repeat-containing sulfotransferase family protein [Sphingomonas adhaesiva]|uniref:tetratricopeptide repeat-containing sulfotransferase family protein n=1 Tax=Sphingomonas adhaesiva TaxID=28212 RepID=UPI002FF5D857